MEDIGKANGRVICRMGKVFIWISKVYRKEVSGKWEKGQITLTFPINLLANKNTK